MEAEVSNVNSVPHAYNRLLSAIVPVLLISIGYVDPGKWAAAIDGGARFGFDLVSAVLLFNLAAILCQYFSARIGVVTGKSLAEICSDEYDAGTCMLLGVQTELSIIALDLTLVLGVSQVINLLIGLDLLTCVFFTAIDAVLFPLFASFLENYRAKLISTCIAGFVLLSYAFGVLLSQPDITLSFNWVLTKLNGESAFALMSLLGANIMPHNFYLHSAIVQKNQSPSNISKGSLCQDHFLAISVIFSGIFLVYYVLIISAANVFYSQGLPLLTFQEAMSLMDQVFRSSVATFGFLLVLYLSNQIDAFTWNAGGQVGVRDFIKFEIPVWLHRAVVRIIAVLAALYCIWSSGAGGMYQLLIFSQVVVALLLPSSVIPLFRIAASRAIMGVYKVSQMEEFLALTTFSGMLGLKLKFLVELIFGDGDWLGSLRWNVGASMSFLYVFLVLTACTCLCLMLWLLATPLNSASSLLDAQSGNWDVPKIVPKPVTRRQGQDLNESWYQTKVSNQERELPSAVENHEKSHPDVSIANFDLTLPETIMESEQESHLMHTEESYSNISTETTQVCHPDDSASAQQPVSNAPVVDDISDTKLPETGNEKAELMDPVEKTVEIEGVADVEREDEVEHWEPEESSKGISGNNSSVTSEGPGSFRSISGKSDESGSGAESLSRLAGLGRAARRQLAAVLDEFWGQLYDYHGQVTREAKAKRLDVLLGPDLKAVGSLPKADITEKEYSGYLPSVGGRGTDLSNLSFYESPNQQKVQSGVESYRTQRGPSSSWSIQNMRLLDAFMQNSGRNVVDSGEKRYSSLRLPPSSDGWDYQPATIHGYQIASYRMGKDNNSADSLNSQMEPLASKSPSLGTSRNFRDPVAIAMGQKLHNGLGSGQISAFQNPIVSTSSALQPERLFSDTYCPGVVENVGATPNTKKYHSLPSISGLAVPRRDLYMPDNNAHWGSQIGIGSSVSRTSYDTPLYPNTGSRVGAPLAFDELSPKVYRGSLPIPMTSCMDTGSLWSRQPFEQFGVTDKNISVTNEGFGNRASSVGQKPTSSGDSEAKLLQSFRHCIVKLLKLEGSDWLFRQKDGADEDLIDHVAAREKFLYEAEMRELNWVIQMGEPQYLTSDRRSGSALKNDDVILNNRLVSSVPHCGEGCIWRADVIISFGVWCMHRILDLSLMESRPELWGKYTYVLNRLQGVIDLAFSKPRSPLSPCFCLQLPSAYQQKFSATVSSGFLPPAAKPARGKCTTAATLLDLVKDVEMAISCRKGRSGTAAGDVAFPKGKENLASVLKRYKRRLSNKPVGTHDGPGSMRKIQV